MKCLCNVPRVNHQGAFALVAVCPKCGRYDVVKVGGGSHRTSAAKQRPQGVQPVVKAKSLSLLEELQARALIKKTNDLPAL